MTKEQEEYINNLTKEELIRYIDMLFKSINKCNIEINTLCHERKKLKKENKQLKTQLKECKKLNDLLDGITE